MTKTPITLDEQIACVEREVKRRKEHMPRQVFARRITAETAELEQLLMAEVLATLKKLKAQS